MTDRVEMPEMLRAAMIARGLDPDAVAAEAATVDLDAPDLSVAPASPALGDGQDTLLGVMMPPTDDPKIDRDNVGRPQDPF